MSTHYRVKHDNEYTLHIFVVLAICVSKIIKFGRDLTKL